MTVEAHEKGRKTGFEGLGRLFLVFVILAVAVALPFVIWGDHVEEAWSTEALVAAGGSVSYAWIIVVALLVIDLVLPVPNTAIIAASGILYGPLLGGLISATGLTLSGLLGYGICRRWGRSVARWLIGDEGLREGERLFARSGGWLVVCSRWLPVLPEVVSCMAGLSRMPFHRFAAAVVCGVVPLAFGFAAGGYYGAERPFLTLVIAALVPLPVWYIIRRRTRAEVPA